jgi:alanine dehydrogenase
MKIGVPKEIKNHEYRVGLTPTSVRELTQQGHQVIIQTHAGAGSGFHDDDYQKAGGVIRNSAQEIFAEADLIVKVKEPQPQECKMLREGQILFTFLHLAPDPEQTHDLLSSGCIAIAYETVTDLHGGLPLLSPMSEVAGSMAPQAGASLLEKEKGGSGILLGGVTGVSPGKVTILGGGVVGANAARIASGMGARVTIFDKNPRRLNQLDWMFHGRVQVLYSTSDLVERYVTNSDLVIGAVLVTGAAAPKLVTADIVKKMRPGSVMVDVAIDQGGCFETSQPTTHANPTYVVDGVIHYCVTNMPGAVARTSTFALNNATMPFVHALANKGYKQALQDDPHLRNGLNIYKGHLTYEAVAKSLNLSYLPAPEALAA